MSKFVKVMDGLKSNAGDFEYKLNEVNYAKNWNPDAANPKDFGGFNFAEEDSIIRWLHRGNRIYDVFIPNDAEVVELVGSTKIYRTNKIIIKNPKEINDELALHYYKISNIPEKSYYKALAAVSVMGYKNTALRIIKDKVNKNNIDEVLNEWNDFINHGGKNDRKDAIDLVNEIHNKLYSMKETNT